MGNPASVRQDDGVISQAIATIFKKRQELLNENVNVDVELSYMEVYKEECFDLLATKTSQSGMIEKVKLDLRETLKGTILDGLTSKPVMDVQTISKYLTEAAINRSVGGTAMNAHSSRSHAICTLSLRISRTETDILLSKLHLVDLAGSERAKKTLATGETFAEGVSINRSLFALGNVVAALAEGPQKASFIPYRDSKYVLLYVHS